MLKGIDYRFIIIPVIAAIAITWFFTKGCGPNNSQPEFFSKKTRDSLLNEQAALRVLKYRDSIALAEENAFQKRRTDSIERRLSIAQLRVNDLIKTGKTLRNQLDYYAAITDTGMINVHPSYIIACDSLADVNEEWGNRFNSYSKECTALTNALHDQLSLGNKEISAHKSQISKLESQNIWLTKGITEISNKYKPRNKMFFGFAAAGTQDQPLYGFGLGFAFMNKKEQLVNADALMIHGGQLMIQVSGKFKISFR